MQHQTLIAQIQALTENVPHPVANLANAAAAIWQEMERINWAGFYLLEGDTLVLGPFQGKPACIEIPMGKGVCGTAAALAQTVVVADVHQFPGHIACDGASNSEIVVPVFRQGKVCGVLDIDSPEFSRFSQEDQACLESVVKVLEKTTFFA